MPQATLINKEGQKQVVESGSQQVADLFSKGYSLMGSPAINPSIKTNTKTNANGELINPTTQDVATFNQNFTTTPAVPKGAVAISGTEFNTKEKQQGAFTNIQPVGNTLYGIPKAPIVPDILPQKDFTGATTPQVLSEGAEKAKGMVGFTDVQKTDLEKANQRLVAGTGSDTDKKNVEYAKSKGWQPTSTEVAPVVEPAKSTADTLFEKYSDIATVKANAKAEAMKTAGLDEKSQNISAAQSVVNKYRTDLQNQGILDIKEQDIRRAQPILTSQIAANLNELSREQKLDTMILQNNYNNALVEQEIAQGNYDRAREIVKETADDAYTAAKDQIEALKFKNEIEEKTAEKLDKELEYERDLAKDGYVLIRSVDGLKGLTEDKIYRDPVSKKIYMKPAPEVATTMEIGGVTYGFDNKGNKIATYGATEKAKTGGSVGTKSITSSTTGTISKNTQSQIDKQLISNVGSDGYLNPADYNLAKEDWVASGGTPASFDTKYKGRRNPKNNYYNVEGAMKPDSVEEITAYKNSGEAADTLINAGYEADKVNKVFGVSSENKPWWKFW